MIAAVAFCLAISALAQSASLPPQPDYVLGPEDVVAVTVNHHPEFSGDFLVPPDGIVELPAVGRLRLAGMSLARLTREIETRLKARLKEPEVTVVLKLARSQKVNVMGDVRTPAVVDMKAGWHLTECLSACGGLAPGIAAADVTVTVLHADSRKRDRLPLNEVLQGAESSNLEVQPGDVVSFDAVETFPVYVVGHVKLPGVYRVRKDRAGVMEAVALAGGLDELAATANVSLTHVNGESSKLDLSPAVLRGEKLSLPALQAGDLIMVPEAQGRVAILGLVKAPGFYPLQDGKTLTLAEAIAQAQGSDAKRARISKVALVRSEDGQQKRYLYDLSKFLSRGDASQNPKLLSGDLIYVPETNTPDWSSVFTSLSTIAVFYSASRR